MAHYAPRADKVGKKIWIWGLSPMGMMWERLLTDTDGQYVEIQSGRHFNQASPQSTLSPFKHRGFSPYGSDVWEEYWYPVKGTKGFVEAGRRGALNISPAEAGGLNIRYCPIEAIKTQLELRHNGRVVLKQDLDLQPLQVFSYELPAALDLSKVQVALGGKTLYDGNPQATVLSRPLDTPKDFDWRSAYGLYLKGKEEVRQRHYAAAEKLLTASLKKDPLFLPALSETAMLLYRNMEYEQAEAMALKALSIDTYDAQANFCHGLASLKLGHLADAKDGFDIASQSVEYRLAAYTELAKIFFREGEFNRAGECARRSLDSDRFNLGALQLLCVIARRSGQEQEAQRRLEAILALDPLNDFARFEKHLLGEIDTKEFLSPIRCELPDQELLELAIWYHGIGLPAECSQILELMPNSPLALYWLAHITGHTGQGRLFGTDRPGRLAPNRVCVSVPCRDGRSAFLGDISGLSLETALLPGPNLLEPQPAFQGQCAVQGVRR